MPIILDLALLSLDSKSEQGVFLSFLRNDYGFVLAIAVFVTGEGVFCL